MIIRVCELCGTVYCENEVHDCEVHYNGMSVIGMPPTSAPNCRCIMRFDEAPHSFIDVLIEQLDTYIGNTDPRL